MKKIVIKSTTRYPEDTKHIVKVLAERGYEATELEAEELWEKYSDSMAAGWMGLPVEGAEVFSCIKVYFEN